MSVAGPDSFSLRPSSKPLLFALFVALSIHVVIGTAVVFLGTIAVLHAIVTQNNQAHEQRIETVRALQETPLLFVEVDPTQAAKDAPRDAKYYSSQNSRAANPDAQIDTGVPKIEGTQTHVPKAETTQQSRAMPLQPSPPKNSNVRARWPKRGSKARSPARSSNRRAAFSGNTSSLPSTRSARRSATTIRGSLQPSSSAGTICSKIRRLRATGPATWWWNSA